MTEGTAYRTHTCGSLRTEHAGQTVRLAGWVHARRDHRSVLFLDLRDRYGMTQVVITPETTREPADLDIHDEDVLLIEGSVVERPAKLVNPHLATGTIELQARHVTRISASQNPPFEITKEGDVNEDLRLAYRYLDLRRERLKNNILFRDRFITALREFLHGEHFVEIETPILTKSTPEGARDYIVPSRLHPGMFYALPQSPQQYKQLLMVAGMDRYFQIARCFRDEDQRGDRQPEFTQLDMEMSFVDREDVMRLTEQLFTTVLTKLGVPIARMPFPRMTHAEAMEKYGSDKPDLRTEEEKKSGALAFCWVVDFPLFESEQERGHYAPSHHMFTAPLPEDISLLESDPFKVRSTQYDLACNGHEVGGGSIRIHDRALQETIFRLVGFDPEQTKRFQHLLDAFEYGVPPHGGIASGLERLLMVARGEPSIREVMAFPKNQKAEDVLFHAPSPVDPEQLKELHIRTDLPRS